jgi:hypothetical protein
MAAPEAERSRRSAKILALILATAAGWCAAKPAVVQLQDVEGAADDVGSLHDSTHRFHMQLSHHCSSAHVTRI